MDGNSSPLFTTCVSHLSRCRYQEMSARCGLSPIPTVATWIRHLILEESGSCLPSLEAICLIWKASPFATGKSRLSTPTAAVAPAWSPTADIIVYLQPTEIPGQTPSAPPSARLWLNFVDGRGQQLYPNL